MKSENKIRFYSAMYRIQHTLAFALIIIKTKKRHFCINKKNERNIESHHWMHGAVTAKNGKYTHKQLGCCAEQFATLKCIYFGFRQFDDATHHVNARSQNASPPPTAFSI